MRAHWLNPENRPVPSRRPYRQLAGYSGSSGLEGTSLDDLVRRLPRPDDSFEAHVSQAKHILQIWDEGHEGGRS